MLKFFRKIRQKLLSENRFSKYLIYAAGEIILVVAGILIALQINTWNENRKQNNSLKISIASLKDDLKRDTIQLNVDIESIQQDLSALKDFKTRLSSPNATIDTLIHIARYEYLPWFDPSNDLNRNTITSLLSTGDIEYFDANLKSKILSHNSNQLKSLRIMDQNVSVFLASQQSEGLIMQSENQSSWMQSVVIKGPLLEKYWANKDEGQFLERMLTTLSGKITMQSIILGYKEDLLIKTTEMLQILNNWEKDNSNNWGKDNS